MEERKRGKLHKLNRLLRGAKDTTFIEIDGAPLTPPENVRYVVTLDSDTRLPRDAISRLIGKMAHPLNRPRIDAERGMVVDGYAVLQPRVTPSLPKGGEGSLFQTIFSSSSGIDPYASAVSDVYQDMFGEGSYAGKGIYEIDPFEAALGSRAPGSTLLSHDLFEGTYARAGFASDIEVVEEFPSRYAVNARRHHRWARGDWQLLPWILGFAPAAKSAKTVIDELPRIGRWKMIDNLRRTLSAASTMLALLFGWTLPLAPALIWTSFVLATIALPGLIPVASAIFARRPGAAMSNHVRALGADLKLATLLIVLNVTFLADQACLMSDAIVRTLSHLFVSRRHLLEWTPAAQTVADRRPDLQGFAFRMSGATGLAAAALIVAVLFGHGTWVWAAPFAALWFVFPAVARYVSLTPGLEGPVIISDADRQTLRNIARLTWRFFETFVTAEDHMLPPDNFQEDPAPVLAHRTSPTNIGLCLLSVASARDFGWITATQAVERLEATLTTMQGMARFRGHFFNWYDIHDLRVLEPKYISSVDSGNLAGHLIALANACREWKSSPPGAAVRFAGIVDMRELTSRIAAHLRFGRVTQTVTPRQLEISLADLTKTSRNAPTSDATQAATFADLAREADNLVNIARAIALERSDGTGADLLFWSQATLAAILAHQADIAISPESLVARVARLIALEDSFRSIAMGTEFGCLFDPVRQLLSIGFLMSESALDPNCYDLLASEARLASFFAIAKGDIPARHWFRLGRAATPVGRGAALISWSGSMFEYLMPPLVMNAPKGSLLGWTDRLIVRRQIEYGAAKGLPWGISESAYNARDLELTYQYSNFGVPCLGLKRGLGESSVAPYATELAAMIDPAAAVASGETLAKMGARGRYGLYEAVDFTPTRVQEGETFALVRNFMAHHQGMTIAPTGAEPDEYKIHFSEDRAEIVRRDGSLTTMLEVLVSAEDDAEVRRVTIVNSGVRSRDIEITSYAELAWGPQAADIAHLAVAKLVVETEYLVDLGAIVATRRKRAPSEPDIWAAHLGVANGEVVGKPEFETDRARFLGRGHGGGAPLAMRDARPLTNSVGDVLDPIFALRRRISVGPGATVRVAFWTMAAKSRAALLDCIDKHRDAAAYERATTLAWTQGQVQLHHLGVKPSDAGLFQRLAGHIVFSGRVLRPASETIRRGSGPQSQLWSQGISGDLPIILVRTADTDTLGFVHQALQAH